MTASDNDEISENPDKKYRGNVPVIDSIDQMTPVERKLTKLFKCSFYRNRCFFTSDDPASFMRHLEARHKGENAYCIYCYYYSGENKSYERTEGLIDHILTHHGFRNFQCNSCVYRGTSIPHVLLHQANIHGNKYQTTLSGEGSIGLCKVLVCKQIVNGPLPSETVHWSNCRVDRVIASPKESPKYQCLYCDFVSLVPHVVFFHICKVHPDFSLCLFDKYVDPLPEIEEADEKNAEEALDDEDLELDAIVNELHGIGTKDDDDVDMTPVDEPVAEIFSDDENENQNRQDTGKEETTRERLFAVKGLRIAKKQSDSSKARKSTSKPSVRFQEPEFDKDDDDDDGEEELSFARRIRGFRPEQSAALFTPVALTGSKHSARNMFKCTICADGAQLSRVSIESHLKHKHGTTSSFKCSECDFLGSSKAIDSHFRAIHSSIESTVRYIKFIVALDEKEEASKTIMGQPVRPGTNPAPKSSKKPSEKDPKNLSSRIKKSVFVGPANWKAGKRQKRKEPGDVEQDSGSDAETICGDPYIEEMTIDDQEQEQEQEPEQEPDNRTNRRIHRAKRKARDSEVITSPNRPGEELFEPKSSQERGSELFFCLFCNTFSSTNFDEAQTHMKLHLGLDKITCPKCLTFECANIRDLKLHCENEHPFDSVELDDNNKHINYITEFLNEQFIRRFKSDQMSAEQASRYARIICPICERANQLTGTANYHHISWKAFKRHFWKHANATYINCKICKALVPRIIKRNHLEMNHYDEISEDISDLKDLSRYYDEPLSIRALNCLKSYKLKCKAFYESRIKEDLKLKNAELFWEQN